MYKIKSIYEPSEEKDGFRILVDKSWPENLDSDGVKVDLWLKEIAPTKNIDELPEEILNPFEKFKEKYRGELQKKKTLIALIRKMEKEKGTVTLLYSSPDPEHNGAIVLKDKLSGYGVVRGSVGRIHGGWVIRTFLFLIFNNLVILIL